MSILIGSDSIETAAIVAILLSSYIQYTVLVYDYAAEKKLQDCDKYIIVGAPKNVKEYKILCANGFAPEHVYFVSTTFKNCPDNLYLYYEDRLETYKNIDVFNIVDCIYNSVKCDLTKK